MTTRIYLDNAATSWPKPAAVCEAVDRYQRENGAPFGRGASAAALEVARQVEQARRNVSQLLGVPDARRIVFTASGTDSLHLAVAGLFASTVTPVPHVVTTVLEHNSVLRALRALADLGRLNYSVVGCDGQGIVDPAAIEAAITPTTRLVVVSQASNVTGAIQPITEICAIAHRGSALCLVDAAQAVGELELNAQAAGVDLLAASGHKGLLGPLGTGVLYIRPGVESLVAAVRPGGTGIDSESEYQPTVMPARYEAGNLNVPGIVGLAAGTTYLLGRGISSVRQHVESLTAQLLARLAEIPEVVVHGPSEARQRVGIVSITCPQVDVQELASLLDAAYGVQTRAGLHCSPRMHAALRTAPAGTLRVSLGPLTTEAETEAFSDVLPSALTACRL